MKKLRILLIYSLLIPLYINCDSSALLQLMQEPPDTPPSGEFFQKLLENTIEIRLPGGYYHVDKEADTYLCVYTFEEKDKKNYLNLIAGNTEKCPEEAILENWFEYCPPAPEKYQRLTNGEEGTSWCLYSSSMIV